jgi:DNA primase
MNLSAIQIKKAIHLLNIPTNGVEKDGWLGILCPMHNDNNFGNCSINLESGRTSCFSCHQSVSVLDLLIQKYNCTFSEALFLIGGSDHIIFKDNINTIKKNKKIKGPNSISHNFEEIVIKPENYMYTKTRGFTQEFCNEFNITRCLNGNYIDYLIIPCIDTRKGILEFESRRLMEYEYLKSFFEFSILNFKRLQNNFKKYIIHNKIKLASDYTLLKNSEIIYDSHIKYLLQPKVKYVANSQLYRTIWNIDNLDFNEELYLVEGIGSIPKIWVNLTKNCSCTFGSLINEEQIDILKQFKKIVVIPDYDLAGYSMIKKLHLSLSNFVVKEINKDDTDSRYVLEIKKTREISPQKYLGGLFTKF